MKNSMIYIWSLLLIIGIMTSCSEDYLESTHYGALSEDTYFKTPDAGMKMVADCYQPMLAHFPFSINKGAMGSEITDDADVGGSDPGDRPQIRLLATGKPLSSNALLNETWTNRYQGIGKCNYGISGLSTPGLVLYDASGQVISEGVKSRYLSEMKFLRAFYYFDLATAFGGVPLLTTPAAPEDKNKIKRSTIEEVHTQILKDLDECIADANMPRAKAMSTDELGRASKDAALALKARVTLFFAGLMEQGKVSGSAADEYILARDAAAEVVNNGGFALMPDYQNLFRGDYIQGTQSEECIFTVLRAYKPEIGFDGDAFAIMNVGRNDVGGWGGNNPTRDLAAEYETGDPRKLFTIISHLDTFPRLDGTKEIHNYDGYYNLQLQQSRKAFVPDKYRNGDFMRTNWSPYYIRYADVLLMYAEAILKTGGDVNRVADLINQVRYRGFVTTSKVDEEAIYRKFQTDLAPIDDATFNSTYKLTATSSDALMKAIKHERRVELGMESLRFIDLLRWGDYVKQMNAYYNKYQYADKGKDVTDKTWPFPIPQVEIDRSGGTLTQTPGY